MRVPRRCHVSFLLCGICPSLWPTGKLACSADWQSRVRWVMQAAGANQSYSGGRHASCGAAEEAERVSLRQSERHLQRHNEEWMTPCDNLAQDRAVMG